MGTPDAFTRRDRAIIKAEINRLEKARKDCTDGGIRKQIEVWIEAQKKKLASENNPK
jgi:hypothetical protein